MTTCVTYGNRLLVLTHCAIASETCVQGPSTVQGTFNCVISVTSNISLEPIKTLIFFFFFLFFFIFFIFVFFLFFFLLRLLLLLAALVPILLMSQLTQFIQLCFGLLALHSRTRVLCLFSRHLHVTLLQDFPPLLQFQLQHVFLPCAHHHTIRVFFISPKSPSAEIEISVFWTSWKSLLGSYNDRTYKLTELKSLKLTLYSAFGNLTTTEEVQRVADVPFLRVHWAH